MVLKMNNYSSENKLVLSDEITELIMSKIVVPNNTTKCWEWNGVHYKLGYARFGSGIGITDLVHRLMYELIKGKIKEGLILDHTCSNKGCVNPDHLEEVTYQENLLRGNNALMHLGFCKHGHARTSDNIFIKPNDGKTRCRKCNGRYHPEHVDKKYNYAKDLSKL